MGRTSFDAVPAAEANVRRDRVLSVPCPRCGAGAGVTCVSPNASGKAPASHGARWDAWYKANPERADA